MPPPGAISSAARKPVSPTPAASSSTRWPGCGSIASTSQLRDGHRRRLEALVARAPAVGRALPALAHGGAQLVGVGLASGSRSSAGGILPSSRRSSLPEAVRGSCVGERDLLRDLEARELRGDVGAQLLRLGVAAVVQHDGRDDRLAPLRVRPAVDAGVGDRRVREQRRLDLRRRDVLAARDDRVGLAAGDRAGGRARRARRGRRCAASRRRRRRRARRSGRRRGSRRRLRSRRAGRRSGRPAVSGSPGSEVATCEQASVMPYVCATGMPASLRPRGERRRQRAAADQRDAQRVAAPCRPASSRRSSVVGTSETSVMPSRSIARQHALGVEALVQHDGRAVDRAAEQDREAADVAERQRAEPAVVAGRGRARAPSRARSRASCRSSARPAWARAVVPEVWTTVAAAVGVEARRAGRRRARRAPAAARRP